MVRVVGCGTSVVRVVRWEGGGREVVGLGRGGVVQGGAEGRGPEGGVVARRDEREGEHFCVYFSACPMPKHNRYRQQKKRG